ncbi:hypothetical protein HMPREF3103_04380 [Granulicatella sp. HMSC30F09]|uniref:hypothetical protein n=1 Tax=Granulicatella sp. HMSC30F09 TaxID=1581071 RepID=UPI0008A48F42|nr:hypothetical protein [Granulicatella sp. HMSC30F09]OFT80050.1 hypothetical protein HMPREF3103_04380 [Granulicatella sp. HMSC30F09]
MRDRNSVFGASFEQSKRIVPRRFVTEDGAQMGVSVSMNFWKRALGLVGLMFSALFYMLGVSWPDGIRHSVQNQQSVSSVLVGDVGHLLRPIVLTAIILFSALIILNLIPKLNYAFQLLYATLVLIAFFCLCFIGSLPLSVGLTIDAFGWIAFGIQLLLCIFLFKKLFLNQVKRFKDELYNRKEVEVEDWEETISKLLKRYGGILLGLAILNRWTFKIGENFSANTDLGNFLFGFVFLGMIYLFFFVGGLVFKNFIRGFYFFKYRNEYREYFNITNEQWYGKFRARFMSKQK